MKRLLLGLSAALALSACAATGDSAAPASAAGPRAVNLPGRPAPAVYSNAVRVGNTLYLSGKLGVDPATGEIPERIEDEIKLALDGMAEVLGADGMTMNDLVSVTVFCSDVRHYDRFNAIYATYFNGRMPARAFVGSGPLLRGAHFEVTGIAATAP